MALSKAKLRRGESRREGSSLASYSFRVNVTENVNAVIHGPKVFELNEPIDITVLREGNLWVLEYKPLGISAYGSTKLGALRAFAEEFSSCWRWIAQERDSQLGGDARELKRKLLALVRAVKPKSMLKIPAKATA
jgi:hypothetical protein